MAERALEDLAAWMKATSGRGRARRGFDVDAQRGRPRSRSARNACIIVEARASEQGGRGVVDPNPGFTRHGDARSRARLTRPRASSAFERGATLLRVGLRADFAGGRFEVEPVFHAQARA